MSFDKDAGGLDVLSLSGREVVGPGFQVGQPTGGQGRAGGAQVAGDASLQETALRTSPGPSGFPEHGVPGRSRVRRGDGASWDATGHVHFPAKLLASLRPRPAH